MHLPRIAGVRICDAAKHLRRYKVRRRGKMIVLTGPDSKQQPFGAMLHMDWLDMKTGNPAYYVAPRALLFTVLRSSTIESEA